MYVLKSPLILSHVFGNSDFRVCEGFFFHNRWRVRSKAESLVIGMVLVLVLVLGGMEIDRISCSGAPSIGYCLPMRISDLCGRTVIVLW